MNQQKKDWLMETKDYLDNGKVAQIEYDREGDVLDILFALGSGCGIELTDEIVLRYDPTNNKPLSLIFVSFSHLIQPTEYGPESFRLTGVERLPPERRDIVMGILTSAPVNRYLRISALSLPPEKRFVPITYVQQPLAMAA
jgi:hypothetical protein